MGESNKIVGASPSLIQAANNAQLRVTENAKVEPGSNLEPGFHAFSSPAAAAHEKVILAASFEQLEGAVRRIWAGRLDGSFTEDDAEYLHSIACRRRPPHAGNQHLQIASFGQGLVRRVSKFKPRQHERSPDKQKSRERRRSLAGSGALPSEIRKFYTEGQRAVLTIIALEIKNGNGACTFPVGKIAAKAGVCRTTVQSTLHEASRLGHIWVQERKRSGRKNLTNIVTVTSFEWKKWIQRGSYSNRTIGSNLVKKSSPTKTRDIKKVNSSLQIGSKIVDHTRQNRPIIMASPSTLGLDVVWSSSPRVLALDEDT